MKNILSKEELAELLAPMSNDADVPKLRAMIISGRSSIVARVSGVLQGLGFRVDAVSNPTVALEELDRGSFQIILTEFGIWARGGEPLFESIEQVGASPVLFFMLRPDEVNEAGRLLDLGVAEVIYYPIDADALDRILERALDLSSHRSRSPLADLHDKYKGLHRAYDTLWRQIEALRDQNQMHRALLLIRKRLSAPHENIGEVISTGMDLLRRFMGADAFGVVLVDRDTGTLETHLRAVRPDIHQEAGSLFFQKISHLFPGTHDPMKGVRIPDLERGTLIKSTKVVTMRRREEGRGAVAVFFAEKRLLDRKMETLLRHLSREIMDAAGRVDSTALPMPVGGRPGIFPYRIFEQMLEQEIFRLERHEGRFGLLRVASSRGEGIAQENWARLAPAVGSVLRRGDCLAIKDSGGMFIFLDELTLEGVCRVAGRIYKTLKTTSGLERPAIGGTLYIPSTARGRTDVMGSLSRALELARKDRSGGIIIHKGIQPGYRRVQIRTVEEKD